MPDKPLTDTEAHERLHAAREVLGDDPGQNVRADTALNSARKALDLLSWGLVKSMEDGSDQVESVKPSDGEVPKPPR